MRKGSRKTPIEQNTPKASKSSKRVSNAKTDATKTLAKQTGRTTSNAASNTDETQQEAHSSAPLVRDISEETYTLYKLVIVSSIPVVSDTDFLKLGEFNFREFATMNVRKADDTARKQGFQFETGDSKATLSAKGIKVMDNITITVEDASGWKKVEAGIERWMLAGKKEIAVKLNIHYPKTTSTTLEESEDDELPTKKVSSLF